MRVSLIKEFVMQNFPQTPLLNYALEVEKITTTKKPNLVPRPEFNEIRIF